jgi:hypothetical protein
VWPLSVHRFSFSSTSHMCVKHDYFSMIDYFCNVSSERSHYFFPIVDLFTTKDEKKYGARQWNICYYVGEKNNAKIRKYMRMWVIAYNEKHLTVQNIAEGASLNDTRASPKLQFLSLQSELASIFLGFRSRWNKFPVPRTSKYCQKNKQKSNKNLIDQLKDYAKWMG